MKLYLKRVEVNSDTIQTDEHEWVSEVAQSRPTLCDPMDCSLPGSSLHGILLEWVAISFSRGSSWPWDWTRVSCIPGRRFNLWATREDLEFFLKLNKIFNYWWERRHKIFLNVIIILIICMLILSLSKFKSFSPNQ